MYASRYHSTNMVNIAKNCPHFRKIFKYSHKIKKKPTGIGNHKFCDNKLRRTTSKAAIEDHYQIDMNELSNENEMNSMSLFAIVTTTATQKTITTE